mmetsp:Transcript_150019/g.482134  ORF Transcript_150019/g.482134 Transcript_150019/m.482134 type:complete len:328 (+) Transcript_150019:2680-3663(+)
MEAFSIQERHCPALEVEKMSKRSWPVAGVNGVHWPPLRAPDPSGELLVVRDGGRQHHHGHLGRQQDDDLLPHHAAICVVDVVDLVEDHPLHAVEALVAPIEHGSQDLRGHDDDTGVRVHRHISRDDADSAHALETLTELAELLVGQGLDRRGINGAHALAQGVCDRVLRDNGLARRRVRADQNMLGALDTSNGTLLEGVQLEGEFQRGVRHLLVEATHLPLVVERPLPPHLPLDRGLAGGIPRCNQHRRGLLARGATRPVTAGSDRGATGAARCRRGRGRRGLGLPGRRSAGGGARRAPEQQPEARQPGAVSSSPEAAASGAVLIRQ